MKFWFGKKDATESTGAPEKADAAAVTAPVGEMNAASSASSAASPAPQASVRTPATPPPSPVSSVPIRPQKGQKALYYQMMNALYDALLILDDNGHIVDCNERASSIFGHSREELWDAAVTMLIPGINPQIFAKMKDGLHGNRRVLINARCHRKDGSSFPGEVGAGLMDLTGENLVLTVRNIEKRAPVRAIIRPAANNAPEEAGA